MCRRVPQSVARVPTVCVEVEHGLTSLLLVCTAEVDLVVGVVPAPDRAEEPDKPHVNRLRYQYGPYDTRLAQILLVERIDGHLGVRRPGGLCLESVHHLVEVAGHDRTGTELARGQAGAGSTQNWLPEPSV